MTTELKVYLHLTRRSDPDHGKWFYTWKVSSLYTPNPVYGPFDTEEEAREDAARHEARNAA